MNALTRKKEYLSYPSNSLLLTRTVDVCHNPVDICPTNFSAIKRNLRLFIFLNYGSAVCVDSVIAFYPVTLCHALWEGNETYQLLAKQTPLLTPVDSAWLNADLIIIPWSYRPSYPRSRSISSPAAFPLVMPHEIILDYRGRDAHHPQCAWEGEREIVLCRYHVAVGNEPSTIKEKRLVLLFSRIVIPSTVSAPGPWSFLDVNNRRQVVQYYCFWIDRRPYVTFFFLLFVFESLQNARSCWIIQNNSRTQSQLWREGQITHHHKVWDFFLGRGGDMEKKDHGFTFMWFDFSYVSSILPKRKGKNHNERRASCSFTRADRTLSSCLRMSLSDITRPCGRKKKKTVALLCLAK